MQDVKTVHGNIQFLGIKGIEDLNLYEQWKIMELCFLWEDVIW